MRARLLSWTIWLLVAATLQGLLPAHEDTHIALSSSALVGLPERYSPAEFDSQTFRLRIGQHATTLHPFLQYLFEAPHDLGISASWYHDNRTLPPYLVLHIQPKTRQFHYEILFNLDTLKLIDLSITVEETDRSSRSLGIAIPDEFRKSMDASIETQE